MSDILGLTVDDRDNVATIFSNEAAEGASVRVVDRAGAARTITALQDIPYGHKIAIADIPSGACIVKYGQVIGRAVRDISLGDHVHTQNIESCRGRGDWEVGADI